jgi:hypothetical protein
MYSPAVEEGDWTTLGEAPSAGVARYIAEPDVRGTSGQTLRCKGRLTKTGQEGVVDMSPAEGI